MNIFGRKANEQGNQFLENGDYQAAEQEFIEATKQAPNWSSPWYNLGLIYKIQKSWDKSQACNKKAAELNPKDEAAWWNLGIASTALGDWKTARFAWKNFGIDIPEGEGPIEANYGLTPIRLNPDSDGEVVWCNRIDPARAVIQNIPFPTSQHRHRDLLLHDGAPNGYRKFRGQEIPVFDQLGLLEKSPYSTFEIVADAPSKTDRQQLMDLLFKKGIAAEDWSSVRMLCNSCSRGEPHESHQPQEHGTDGPLVRYGVASRSEDELVELLKRWEADHKGVTILEFDCVLRAEEV